MQFLKKHYEKVLLSIVLLGLAAAAAALPWQVSHERDRLEEIRRNLTVKVKPKPFQPLDDWLSTNRAVLARLETPLNIDLAGEHNLFNPVPWKKLPGGQLVPIRKGNELGPGAVRITKIHELKLEVSFTPVAPAADGTEPAKYVVVIRRETDRTPRPTQRTTSMATPRNDLFELLRVEGPTNQPTALVIKLRDQVEPISVMQDKPFTAVVGYAADLEYPPGKQTFSNRRKDDRIDLKDDPEQYKIVAITPNQVVLSADSNKRRTVIKYNASSSATASTK
ncbi:MAG: hypothetical protein AB9869_32265 [Verrucomicrobiia bacterium]